MSDDWLLRTARREDMPAAYAVFRRSIYGYLHRIGLVGADEAADPPVNVTWRRQSGWVEHLWDTAAENWIATDAAGESILAWALAVERGGHLELAFFFVDPATAARGIGRRLLERAFSGRPETRRTIMATQEPSALSLYLRSGVRFLSTACDIGVSARPTPPRTDLAFRPLAGPEDVAAIAGIEERILGLRRETDLAFLAKDRPGWLAFRGSAPIGYAFAMPPERPVAADRPPECGPIAALDTADLPALIDHVLAEAPAGPELSFTVPLANRTATEHLLALGGRIDPFYICVLSSEDLSLDRYIHTSPSFII